MTLLALVFAATALAPPPTTTVAAGDGEGTGTDSARAWPRRLVVGNFYGLHFSILFPVPSLDLSLFVGRAVGRLAFGVQSTLTLGPADLIALATVDSGPEEPGVALESIFLAPPLVYHRHHLTMIGHGGRRDRLFYSLGGGLWWVGIRYAELVGAEAEARVGRRFRARNTRRLRGVAGGQFRLSGAFRGIPMPTFGAFVGFDVF